MSATEFDYIDWSFDLGASGPRWRGWVKSDSGEKAELYAYENGGWFYCIPKRQYPSIEDGHELDLESAKKAAYEAWKEETSE